MISIKSTPDTSGESNRAGSTYNSSKPRGERLDAFSWVSADWTRNLTLGFQIPTWTFEWGNWSWFVLQQRYNPRSFISFEWVLWSTTRYDTSKREAPNSKLNSKASTWNGNWDRHGPRKETSWRELDVSSKCKNSHHISTTRTSTITSRTKTAQNNLTPSFGRSLHGSRSRFFT